MSRSDKEAVVTIIAAVACVLWFLCLVDSLYQANWPHSLAYAVLLTGFCWFVKRSV